MATLVVICLVNIIRNAQALSLPLSLSISSLSLSVSLLLTPDEFLDRISVYIPQLLEYISRPSTDVTPLVVLCLANIVRNDTQAARLLQIGGAETLVGRLDADAPIMVRHYAASVIRNLAIYKPSRVRTGENERYRDRDKDRERDLW